MALATLDYMLIRPWLVGSFVIVRFYVFIEMRYAIIINYKLFLYLIKAVWKRKTNFKPLFHTNIFHFRNFQIKTRISIFSYKKNRK